MTHDKSPATRRSTSVITAHAGDFVWRAGGAIALAASGGEKGTLACLTCGERGESARARREGKSPAEAKAIRRAEAEQAAAAAVLGAEVRLLDADPNPGLAHPTYGEAYLRPSPQVTGEPT